MSEEIKYEPIYGLQKPFDDGPEDAEAYGIFGNEVIYYKIDKTSVYCFDTDNQWSHIDGAPNIPFLAMRRIIKTPVWTKGDQKAGKLPEVGCEVMVSPKTKATVTAVDSIQKVVAVQCDDESLDILQPCEILPIETEAERQQREREEWVNHAYEKLISATVKGKASLGDIYDALLSGELASPKGGE